MCNFFFSLEKPEFQSASIKEIVDNSHWAPVDGGITNFNYQVTLDEHSFFVQILDSHRIKQLPTQHFVPNNQVIEKNVQLKPWLVPCLHETKELRVFEWSEGVITSANTFDQPGYQTELCDFLSILHSNISILPVLDINQHLEHYYQLAIKNKPDKKKEFKKHYLRAKECAKSFIPTKNCHNDLSPGNILISQNSTDKKLQIVDWEYACISDPFFDLAGVCVNFEFSDQQQQNLIQNYSENMAIYPNMNKFNKMKELYQLINLLWCA